MKKLFLLPILLGLLISGFLVSCSSSDSNEEVKPTPPPSPTTENVSMDTPELVFGFIGQNRYSYCPSSLQLEDGTIHMFFCGNPTSGIMVDNIYHIKITPDGKKTAAKSVLQPGASGSWDDHHTCDPSVVEGCFKYNEISYKYAMFFLSNMYGVYYNEIGVAFSNDLDADSWVKYPEQIVRKTWTNEGDQSLGGNNKSWGVGQPSAVSLDKKGKILLAYTRGDFSGTSEVWSIVDFSDMSNYSISAPKTVITTGCKQVDKQTRDILSNVEFAINQEEDKIVMIRPLHPFANDYPTYIASALEIDYMNLSDFLNLLGTWTSLYRITESDTDYPRNHNATLQHDTFGHIEKWSEPTFYFTVSKAAPNVAAGTTTHAEWTYHIWKSKIIKK